jgi:excisionase family DNA binding protein
VATERLALVVGEVADHSSTPIEQDATAMQDAHKTDYLTPQEFAGIAGLSLSTVRRRMADGSLPVWQPGGRRTAVRIHRSALTTSHQPPDPSVVAAPSPAEAPPSPRCGPQPRWKKGL